MTWLWSDATDGPFVFVNVCEALGLDPSYVRAGLMRWTPDTGRPPVRRMIGRLAHISHAAQMGAARPKGDAA